MAIIPIITPKMFGKMWDTLDKGLSGLARPWQTKRDAEARAEARKIELLSLAQTEVDVGRIRRGELILDSSGKLLPNPVRSQFQIEHRESEGVPSPKDITPSLNQSPIEQLLLEQKLEADTTKLQQGINLKKIQIFAEEEAEKISDEKVSDEPVNDDWFTQWRNRAQDVSDEQMQKLWAKIIAGEVKSPKSYSLHSLDLLARLSKEDADSVAKLAHIAVFDSIIKVDQKYLDRLGLSFDRLLYLDDIGVLNGVSGQLIRHSPTADYPFRGVAEKITILPVKPFGMFFIASNLEQTVIDFPIYGISKPAVELLQLIEPNAEVEYMQEIAKVGKSLGCKVIGYGPATFDGMRTTMHPHTAIILEAS